jgi:hypothetical protein
MRRLDVKRWRKTPGPHREQYPDGQRIALLPGRPTRQSA